MDSLGSLGCLDRRRVGDDGHDLLLERLALVEDADLVAVALGHLAAVDARHHRGGVEDVGLGDDEDLPELLVELAGDVAGHLQVLLLVLAHRHQIGEVDQDVGRLQHRIGEQPVVGREALGDLVLVADGALEQAHGRDAGEDPGELGDLGDVLLGKKGRLLRVEAEGQEVQSHPHRVLAQELRHPGRR